MSKSTSPPYITSPLMSTCCQRANEGLRQASKRGEKGTSFSILWHQRCHHQNEEEGNDDDFTFLLKVEQWQWHEFQSFSTKENFNILYSTRHDSNLQKRTCGGKRHVNLVRACESGQNMLEPEKTTIAVHSTALYIKPCNKTGTVQVALGTQPPFGCNGEAHLR